MRILVLCLKLEEKQLADQSLYIEKMLIVYTSQKKRNKVGFLVSVMVYAKFSNPCHALKNSVAAKGLLISTSSLFEVFNILA